MSVASEKATADSVPAETQPDPDPVHHDTHETRKSTSSRRPSLHDHASSPFPEAAPVLGAVGWVGESDEKTQAAATAFKHHLSPTVTRPHDHEKGPHEHEHGVEGQVASTATTATIVGEETPEESEGEGEDEVVYPGGMQLALLTFGLCLATFTVALDNTIIATAIPKITSVFDSLGDVG
jgi:hypothetical protein